MYENIQMVLNIPCENIFNNKKIIKTIKKTI